MLDDGGTSLWPGSTRSGEGSAVLPRGEEIEIEHEHLASVVVNRDHPAQVRSAEEPLPLFQKIFGDFTRYLQGQPESRRRQPDHLRRHRRLLVQRSITRHLVTLTFVRKTPTGPGAPETFINDARPRRRRAQLHLQSGFVHLG